MERDFYGRDWKATAYRVVALLPEKDQKVVKSLLKRKIKAANSDRDLEKTVRDISNFKSKFFPNKQLYDASKEELEDAFSKLYKSNLSYFTIIDFRKHVRQFYKEMLGDNYNPIHFEFKVNPKVMRRKKATLESGKDSLSQEEVETLVKACDNWRGKAYIMMSFDAMARVQSLLSMKIKDVEKDGKGTYWLNLKTKEGTVKVDLTFSAPYYVKWLALHPDPNPEQYLFCTKRNGKYEVWGYNACKLLLDKLKKKTGMKKRLHTHIFRRSGANFWKQLGVSDQVIEKRGDWVGGSKSLRTSYLSSNEGEAHEASQAALKGTKPKSAVSIFTPTVCVMCQWQNLPDAEYCFNCHHKLSILEIAKEANRMSEMQAELKALQEAVKEMGKADVTHKAREKIKELRSRAK